MMAWRQNRRQTIIWINADTIHWRIDAALGASELILLSMNIFEYILVSRHFCWHFFMSRIVFDIYQVPLKPIVHNIMLVFLFVLRINIVDVFSWK